MGIDLSLLNFCFEITLFILFIIKGRQLVRVFVVPMLKQQQQETNEKWFALQEQHAILIAKKKHLATLFLQQEKQISLLTAKLETWYKMWEDKQTQRKYFFKKRAQEVASQRATQERMVKEHRTASLIGKKILAKTVKNLNKQATDMQKEYTTKCLKDLSSKGDV